MRKLFMANGSAVPHRPFPLLFILPVFFSFFAPSPGSSKPSNTAGFQFQDPPPNDLAVPLPSGFSPVLLPGSTLPGTQVHPISASDLFLLHLLHLSLLYWVFKPHHGCGSTSVWLLNRWSNKILESLIFLGDIWHTLHHSILLGAVTL